MDEKDFSTYKEDMNSYFTSVLSSLGIGKSYDGKSLIPEYYRSGKYERDQETVCMLLKDSHWPMTDNMDTSITYAVLGARTTKDIADSFESYFIGDNFSMLNHHLNVYWKNTSLIDPKMFQILKDAVYCLRKFYGSDEVNIHNMLIPVLLNQIDGLKSRYLNIIGFQRKPGNQWIGPDGSSSNYWRDLIRKNMTGLDIIMEQSKSFFLDILFQNEKKYMDEAINRHVIIHGCDGEYGNIANTLRCFIVIDFFSSLVFWDV